MQLVAGIIKSRPERAARIVAKQQAQGHRSLNKHIPQEQGKPTAAWLLVRLARTGFSARLGFTQVWRGNALLLKVILYPLLSPVDFGLDVERSRLLVLLHQRVEPLRV